MTSFAQTIKLKIDSGSSVLWVYLQGDEGRAGRLFRQIIKEYSDTIGTELKWHSWDIVSGATWDSPAADAQRTLDPVQALQQVGTVLHGDNIVLMKDLHTFLNGSGPKNLELRRVLIELCVSTSLSTHKRTCPILIFANTPIPHPDIAEYCDVVDFPLPDYEQMEADVFNYVLDSIEKNQDSGIEIGCDEDLKERIVRSLLGINAEEAQRILAYAVAACGNVNEDVLEIIAAEKAKVIRKVEGLTFIPHERIPDSTAIGGFKVFLQWLRKRSRAYTRHAQSIALDLPRGAVLIGPAGTGKTLVAKAAAKLLGLDLVIMDIGSMFDKYVGGSEQKIRNALSMVQAMPNCLLMVDEIDKAFGGAHEGQAADSGVASRVLSYFLSWLSERDMRSNMNRVFVMVTMNRTAGIPEELLRAGRFDRVWSTDLPDKDERKEILEIHLRKRGIDPAKYGKSLIRVVTRTNDFTGAELEEVVISARSDAYDRCMSEWEKAGADRAAQPTKEQCEPTIDDLLAAADEITPVSRLNADGVAAIRKFCQNNTYPVNGERVSSSNRTSRKISAHHTLS